MKQAESIDREALAEAARLQLDCQIVRGLRYCHLRIERTEYILAMGPIAALQALADEYGLTVLAS